MTTQSIRNSISRSPWRGVFLLIPLVLACFALLPRAQAATPEMLTALPDEAVAGFNTRDGLNALISLTSGTFDTGIGFSALKVDSSGSNNTALGAQALLNNTTGSFNTAIGENALVFTTSGSFNMALGQGALANNTTGSNNTAMGFQALNVNNIDGNVGVGNQTLGSNTSAPENVAVGFRASTSLNGSNGFSVAVGFQALANATGGQNTAVGDNCLVDVTSGVLNTAIGDFAGFGLTGGNNNVFIGEFVGAAFGTESNVTRIANIGSTFQNTGIYVTLDSVGGTRLGYVNLSSRRYKDDIKPMDKASEAIFAFKPVTFHFKKEFDPTHGPGYGLIAEEVDKVNPDLVSRNDKGEVMTVRYDAVNAMLLNEFLKEHRKVQELEKQVQVLTAGLQKVSDQLELSKPAPKTVLNNQ